MAFRGFLEGVVSEFNSRVPTKPEFQEFLKQYEGRTVTINIKKDAFYIFSISKEGLKLKVADSEENEDMYIETEKSTLQTMIKDKRISMKDLLLGKVKWRNISLTEVSRVKKILGIQSMDFSKDK